MYHKLKMTADQVLGENGRYGRLRAGRNVPAIEFSAEDATRSDWDFLVQDVSNSHFENGATVINVPDTVGYTTPEEYAQLISVSEVERQNISSEAVISVHCHNDLGMAVANSLSAIGAGATQIECTINGLGERAGQRGPGRRSSWRWVRSKDYFKASSRIDTTQIYRTSKLVYSIIGMPAPINKSIVGANAFAHESGIHQHGVLSERTTYEIMAPESIGLSKNKLVLGKHSGRHAFADRIQEPGLHADAKPILNKYFEEFKKLADKKKSVSDDDIEALINSELSARTPGYYRLERFDVFTSNASRGTCVMSLETGGELLEDVALGDGPIDAAYNAIDKLIDAPEHSLEDYAIHSVSDGKDALGEVVVKIKTGDTVVTGRGLSTNIIESSILAYLNGVNKILERRGPDR